jgi:hypothetical protein
LAKYYQDDQIKDHLRSEVLTAVKMSVLFFWVVTPCGIAGTYQRKILALKMEAVCSSETMVSTYKSIRR